MSIRLPPSRTRLYLGIALLFVLIPASVGFMHIEGSNYDVTRLEINGTPPGGIVFISDPHLRASNINNTREIIQKINELHPSLVLIGGDFTYEDGEDISLNDIWSGVDSPVYAVLGNHDYKSGINASSDVIKILEVRKARVGPGEYNVSNLLDSTADYAYADRLSGVLEENGVKVLRNQYAEIDINGTKVGIVGVDDGWAGMADPPEVQQDGIFLIYIIHEPELRGQWKANLTLAGHTHGGQFIPPGIERVVSGGLLTLSGEIREKNTITYISRGIGTSNLNTELRFLQKPEIVYIVPPDHEEFELDNDTIP